MEVNTALTETTAPPQMHMTNAERRTVGALAAIYTARMLGLFLLLPVLSIYAMHLPQATPALVGLAMGVYGLAQALLQIPFGRWSDRYGRRPVIFIGLGLYLLGSVVGAMSQGVWMLIVARALQGTGAVAAAITALLADSTRDVVRTRAMAVIGISIGGSFVISLIAAPQLSVIIGVPGIFWVTAILAVAGMGLLHWMVPHHTQALPRTQLTPTALRAVALLPMLRPFYAGVFLLHFILTATFLAVPLVLLRELHLTQAMHWRVYLGVFLVSLLGTIPLIMAVERVRRSVQIVLLAVSLAAVAQIMMAYWHHTMWPVLWAFTLFFATFNFLEARLPAGLSQLAPVTDRGAALGVFATCQFLGAACGGIVGGIVLGHFGVTGVFLACAAAAVCWTGVLPRQ